MTATQRERAEAVFGHVQHAVSELIQAAHDALEMLEEAVTTAGLGPLLDRLDAVGESLLKHGPERPTESPPDHTGRVERIPVR